MPVNVKNLIAETFVKLSDEKNIDKITVKDIVEACGISRQAFYYHFQDLLEVIEWSMEQAFGQLLDRSLQEDDPEIVLNDFITASENAAPFMQKLFRSQKREQVERMMARCARSYLQELISAKGKLPRIPYEDLDIALNFCTYGIVGLLLECCDKKKASTGKQWPVRCTASCRGGSEKRIRSAHRRIDRQIPRCVKGLYTSGDLSIHKRCFANGAAPGSLL